MSKKVYKIKFVGEHAKGAKRALARYAYMDGSIVNDDKKRTVLVKAENKDQLRAKLRSAANSQSYCFGVEGSDYEIKNMGKYSDYVKDHEDDYDNER